MLSMGSDVESANDVEVSQVVRDRSRKLNTDDPNHLPTKAPTHAEGNGRGLRKSWLAHLDGETGRSIPYHRIAISDDIPMMRKSTTTPPVPCGWNGRCEGCRCRLSVFASQLGLHRILPQFALHPCLPFVFQFASCFPAHCQFPVSPHSICSPFSLFPILPILLLVLLGSIYSTGTRSSLAKHTAYSYHDPTGKWSSLDPSMASTI